MKSKILCSILILLSHCASAQEFLFPVDEKTKKITYQGIVEVDSISKNEIYDRIIDWVKMYYKTDIDIIDFVNKDAGKLFLTPTTKLYASRNGRTYYVGYWKYIINITVHDFKYEYSISDFVETNTSDKFSSIGTLENDDGNTSKYSFPNRPQLNQMRRNLHEEVTTLIRSLKRSVLKN